MRVEMVSGVFLAIVILLTINSGMPAEVSTTLANEKVWEAILYAYVIDPDAPSYLARGDRIFEVVVSDCIAISSNAQMKADVEYSDSERTAAENLAISMQVRGSYGAFSAAASMSVSRTSDSSIKTVRFDSTIKSIIYEVASIGGLRAFPAEYVTDNFKRVVEELTVEQIEERIGSFYATRMDLGGEIRKSYTMQATSEDDEESVSAELKAEYGSGLMGVSAEASVGVSSRTSNSESQMKVEWSAKGGNTLIWLGKSFSDSGDTSVANIQAEWAKTMTDDNLYPFNFHLAPMWELVKKINQEKGNELQQYLQHKWGGNRNIFLPTQFLTTSNYYRPSNTHLRYDGIWGKWGDMDICSNGGYATSFRQRVESNQGSYDDSALNSICLQCSTGGEVCSSTGYWGDWATSDTCTDGYRGSDFKFEHYVGGSDADDSAANDFKLVCGDRDSTASNGGEWGVWQGYNYCPSGEVICGLKTRVESNLGYGKDDSALNGVILQCCGT